MDNFEFYNPVKIFFGEKYIDNLDEYIGTPEKVMLLYGGGSIKKNGVYKRIMGALRGKEIIEFGGVEPNPTYEKCMEAVEVIKREGIDFILAAGGGSVIDAAKFIGVAALYKGRDPWHILSRGIAPDASLPLGTILTLPATGSEMNKNSVISRKSSQEKYAFSSPYSFPLFSILSPEAAASLPRRQVANGVVDAFVHVMEQYLTYPVNAPVQDRIAEALLITLIEEGPKVYADPSDYEAMSNLMWAASMALNGLISAGVPTDWITHTIGHELTALHNIDHARTLAVVLPGLWQVLRKEKGGKLLQYAERVWQINTGSDDERIDMVIRKTVEFFESLGIETSLSDYNIGRETVDEIASRFEKRRWLEMGDRKLVTPGIVKEVLESRM